MVVLLCVVAGTGLTLLLESKQHVFSEQTKTTITAPAQNPFPVGVDPIAKIITENQYVNTFAYDTLAIAPTRQGFWRERLVAFFFQREWYQNLASPVSRIVVIWPGERKEEITGHIGDILRWNDIDRATFMQELIAVEPVLNEGKFYPGQYVAHRGARPEEVAAMIKERFTEEILDRYTKEVEAQVPLEDALVIASLLEREASDFENMREVSGVIWNRLFINMPLQLDATLQYARGSAVRSVGWWPVPRPADKFIASPFNTYANKGLPPAAIANPTAAAVLAALNPINTDCIYYFHANNGDYFCSVTYEEHVDKLIKHFGQGK
jgi:cell division protein YceG involved in septum cleavage